ncbi:MAG TPA: ParB N-terminal domain-containing protein [Pseudonocardia sp.]|jgi:ParB family chromosome partitioning protein|nr:ParB N-terminal domain-containing protein [Pseudonocardia sp.]
MTNTQPGTETGTQVSESPAGAEHERGLGELLMVAPESLVIGANARRDVVLDAHFCKDVAERGVREPIAVRRDSDGRLIVRKGQRRALAACRAGLSVVRVFVEPPPDTDQDDTAAQVDRLVDQYGENFHRAPISEADEAQVHQQLLDLGLSAGQIARRTHIPAKRVRALHAVNTSPMARAALAGVGGPVLRLDHAAVVAEFDDQSQGAAEAVERLLEAAESDPERFFHVAQRLGDEREERRLVSAHTQTLAAQGVRVLTDEEATASTELYTLRPGPDDPAGTPLTVEEHTSCPGHAVHLTMRMDWSSRERVVHTEGYCTEPERHAPRFDRAPGSSDPGQAPEVSDAELQEAKQRQQAERRRVIANNRAWESATVQRRAWAGEFVARKKPPADAAAFIAATLAGGGHDIRKAMESGHPSACALLGLPAPAGYYTSGPRPLVEAATTATGVRATQLSLAVLLGAYEDGTSRNSWRSPTGETIAYFTALRGWGYPLSDVERLVLDPDADSHSLAEQIEAVIVDRDQAPDAEEGGSESQSGPGAEETPHPA